MINWKVLLVDDEKDFVLTLAERLGLRGIEVITAFDGEGALQILKNCRPDVMILDLMMPGMSGSVVLEKVKKLYPGLQVIILTGMGSTPEGTTGVDLCAFEYLSKPVKIDDLIDKIGRAIKKGSAVN
ncbi:MAG: response regulator [Desulfomonilaceae bacterium]